MNQTYVPIQYLLMYPFRTEFCLNFGNSWQVNVVEPLCFVGVNCHLSRKWEPAALHRACHKSWILLGNMCTWNPNDNWQGSQSNTSSLSLCRVLSVWRTKPLFHATFHVQTIFDRRFLRRRVFGAPNTTTTHMLVQLYASFAHMRCQH